jgi:tetratricopeptide (TPR) repeat protein
MKNAKQKKSKHPVPAAVAVDPAPRRQLWPYAVGLLLALFAVFEVYWPAISGPFLLDDTYLPYMAPHAAGLALNIWIRGLRPLLMFSYWLNFQYAGNQDTFGYHAVNIWLHFFNGILILLAVRKVLSWAQVEKWRGGVLSIFAAGLFLLHPLQTESVSYVASRSETLSVFWVLAAFVVFLYRKTDRISILEACLIVALFGLAVLTKEHTAVLPALFLLTDYFWNPPFSLAGIRRNWRLYLPIAALGVVALGFVWRVLRASNTAGFRVKDLAWYQYFFTECRAIAHYLLLFVFPLGQNVDVDFPISRSLLSYGAIFFLIGLLAVTVAAWIYRRQFPLASYGWFVFLILIAPTSSLVPILDPFAERRLYLPFIGLLFIVAEFLRRWKTTSITIVATLSVILIAEGGLTYQRNQLWGSPVDFWKDSVAKSPHKLRPRFQLAYAYYQAGACPNSADEFENAAQIERPGVELLLDWALAYDCAGKPNEALAKLIQASTIEPSAHVYSQIGMEYGKMGRYPEALDALAKAQNQNPRFEMTYSYLGNIHALQGDRAQAAEDYRRVLEIDPENESARQALASLGR